MTDAEATPKELARWHCEVPLWADFLASERSRYKRSARAAFHLMIGSAIAGVVLAFAVIIINTFVRGGTVIETLQALLLLWFFVSIPLFIGLILWAIRRANDRTLSTPTGEVVFRKDAVLLNGIEFGWTSEGDNHRITRCERLSLPGKTGTFEIIEIEKRMELPGYRTRNIDYLEWRVPVPDNRIADADVIVGGLKAIAISR